MGQDFVSRYYDEIRPLMEARNVEGIAAVGQRYTREWQQHIDDMLGDVDRYTRAVQAVQTGQGPAAVLRIHGETQSMALASFEAMLNEQAREIPLTRAMTDESAQRAAWNSLMMDNSANQTRVQRLMEQDPRGLTEGARRAGMQLPEDIGA